MGLFLRSNCQLRIAIVPSFQEEDLVQVKHILHSDSLLLLKYEESHPKFSESSKS